MTTTSFLILIGSAAIVYVITTSKIFESFRTYASSQSAFLGDLVQCQMCLGTWVGFVTYILGYSLTREYIYSDFWLTDILFHLPLSIVVHGVLTGVISSVFYALVDLLLNKREISEERIKNLQAYTEYLKTKDMESQSRTDIMLVKNMAEMPPQSDNIQNKQLPQQ